MRLTTLTFLWACCAAVALVLAAQAQLPLACGPKPAMPAESEGWAVQVTGTTWRTDIQDWVPAPAPTCWVLGRVPLSYPEHSAPPLPNVQDPGPWIESLDYPVDTPCPAEAHGNCAPMPRAPEPAP